MPAPQSQVRSNFSGGALSILRVFQQYALEVENKSGAGAFRLGPKMELPTLVEEQAKRSALKMKWINRKELKVEEKRSEEQFAAWKTRKPIFQASQ